MQRARRKTSLAIDFAVDPFGSVPALLLRSATLFFSNFPFLAAVTLVVFLPVKLALQAVCWMLEVPTGGLAMYLVLDVSDLVLGSLVAPAAIYGVLARMRNGKSPRLGESLAWGRRQWGRTLWNKFKVEMTVTLWSLLLLVPGLVKMVQLAVTDPIVAIEADRAAYPLERSRDLTSGHRWRVFFVLLPLMAVELVGSYLVLGAFQHPADSRLLIAVVDSLLSVGGQWATMVILLIYLGLVKAETKL